jgi:hypothetical protein
LESPHTLNWLICPEALVVWKMSKNVCDVE